MNTIKTLNRYALYTLLCLVLFSCSDKQTRCYVCEQSESLQVAEFVSGNIKGANNMSDEEMEDVISELRNTGIKLYCKQMFVPCDWQNQVIWEEVKKIVCKLYTHTFISVPY